MLPIPWGPAAGPRRHGRHGRFVLFLLAGLLAGAPRGGGTETEAPLLAPGEAREGRIAAGEVQAFRATVADAPLLLSVEQGGIDLIVEDRPAGGGKPVAVDAPNHRWGSEILLLETPGEHRVEIRSGLSEVPPGRYALRLERLDDPRRREAAAAMTRAGREAAAGGPALERALMAYREALEGWQALGDRPFEAEARSAIADLEKQLAKLPAAAEDYGRALALWRELGEDHRAADLLHWLAMTRLDQLQLEPARQAIAESLALWRRLGERFEEGIALSDAGWVEQTGGALPAALADYEPAQAIFHELGARRDEANVRNSLGGIYDTQGRADAALASYQEALALRRELGDAVEEARVLNNIGVVHRALGEWQAALDSYEQARRLLPASALGEPGRLKAALLNNLSSLYNLLGEPERARTLAEEGLALRRDPRGKIASRNILGQVLRSLGRLDLARAQYREALNLAAGEPQLEATLRLHLAEVLIEGSDPAAALPELLRALDLFTRLELRRGESAALHLEGKALALAGRPEEAVAPLGRALALRRELRDRAGEAQTLGELAAVERRLGRREAAHDHAEAALAGIEALRSGLLSPRLRASFLATLHRAYTLRIDLLMDRHRADPTAGFDRAALEVSERARARSLLDLLGERGNGHREGVPPELFERRRELAYLLSRADQKETPDERKIEDLLAELDRVETEIRRHASPGEPAAPQPLGAAAIPPLLDPGTVLLELALGEERSYAWAIDARGVRSAVLPGEAEIARQARQLHAALSTVEPGGRPAAGDRLGRILLKPLWGKLARAERIVVVPDAALNLIPWGALSVPLAGQGWKARDRVPLVERKEVVEIPSATTLAVTRQRLRGRPTAAKWAAIFADPVFTADDPRFAEARPSSPVRKAAEPSRGPAAPSAPFPRLPATRREAEAIARLAPAGQVWQALDFAANREAVLGGELRRYRVVHFATHGVADTRNPELSGLVLSQVDRTGRPREGFLRLADLYDLDLAADLVVLSACETALGKEVRGEGVMGLTRGFQAAGVPRVVASLWRAEDQATATVMASFYAGMWQERLRPAAALRAAQRALYRNPRYHDPHFWAGFIYQGDWR